MEFDDTHIKFRVFRNLTRPTDLNSLQYPNTFLQLDKFILFPNLSFFPDWGGRFIVISNCQDVLEEINDDKKTYRGSKLNTLSIQSTLDYIDVEMCK